MKKHVIVTLFALSMVCLTQSPALAGGCPNNCSGNGVCDTNTNFCSCDAGWIGVDCGTPSCPGGCGSGTCVSPFVCVCDTGYGGANCDQCAPNYYNYPVCTFCLASTTCSGNGTCTATGTCNCNAGFSGVDCSVGPPVPTVSEWGLAVLTLTGLIAGTILFARRIRPTNA